ncbi:Siderophore-interacting protein OS=Tsukamurella paurometabola (strain ATCC 8368 / DSM / CCUG 35730 / CIP 100753 / JCM 10117 / KCTC 9821 / NBRC 16120 / NCIMB 702349 / NCTC 13040) OX=521096 GN=Tpau_2366 PE=4 SV=1 [Tsukamurella paurometabola]|uniref:Siderophore-interacting protein n=1 Tax=Tsukamurella paurometabola (strain ATCC 8368 / DSM 20162 / CCUG 35730 / CIP 100753 / JCM 10117 / KCTC 9821 / NBRC 16120 / NCIMB 702349 / NCTC 13040) TaxID=521096 RepID=D5UQY3_TSUPD|nr:siderophore-interacting protein [Tsukamurella paurometabola]ADG78972.1 Siderophore-interacting protein [Tsukamurella paurometabola DSM 20162]SUP33659.1 Vibriobactin utilization protein ViuB [Tsukamurella paurometabola]
MTENPTPTKPRRTRPQYQLTVVRTERLSEHLVRVVAEGDALATFGDPELPGLPSTDSYVKLLFGDVTRTYTVRSFDRPARRITIDFVVHGDEGLAGPWAQRAEPGDSITLMGPGGSYTPDPDAAWHLLAGDLSAVPAIASALEALPADAHGLALIETTDGERIELAAPSGIEVRWLTNPDTADTEFLSRAVRTARWPEDRGTAHVFAHGERESIKAIRRVLRELGLPRERLSISGYWARGRAEDAFQAEKREPIGQIE